MTNLSPYAPCPFNIPYNERNVQVNEISFFLSGGDFLHKKIEILDDTIIKNSEMYNSILDKREQQMAELKQSQMDLEAFNEQKDSEIEELKRKLEELLQKAFLSQSYLVILRLVLLLK